MQTTSPWRHILTPDAPTMLLTLLILISLPSGTYQGPNEKKLFHDIFVTNAYQKLERPVRNESEALTIQFGLVLNQVIDVDEKNQILTSNIWLNMDEKNQMINTNIWLNMKWNDYSLVWNTSDYGGLSSIRIPPLNIWKPDILMYNSADEDIDSTFPTNVVVSSDGTCLWVPPGLFLSTCKIDITWFPFDEQKCDMKFGSWTYDGGAINLTLDGDSGDASNFISNGEWELLGFPAKRSVYAYDCCPEQYVDITFTMKIRRRKLYYVFNLVVPCLMLFLLSLLMFTMPPDAGEKITCGVTILLSLTVFLLLVAETMPPTSDAVPLIGMYFACIMLMCSMSVMFTVLVLNYHHRTPDTHTMPRWVRKGICEWLAWILRISRPGKDLSRKQMLNSARMRDLELQERSSKSLLANVLDLEDDFRGGMNNSSRNNHSHNHRHHIDPPSYASVRLDENIATALPSMYTSTSGANSNATPEQTDLKQILKELKFLTEKIKKDEEFAEECNDWKFAAHVVDRLCLWLFTLFTVVSTFAILFSAPNIFA